MKVLKSGIQNDTTHQTEVRTIQWSQADLNILHKAAALLATAREIATDNFAWEEPEGSNFMTAEAFLSEMLAEAQTKDGCTVVEVWQWKSA